MRNCAGLAAIRVAMIVLATIVAAMLATPASALTHKDYADCDQSQDDDRGIAACTRIIEDIRQPKSSRSAAAANRCNDYRHKLDYGHAIEDCLEAVRIDPGNANGWNALGVTRNDSGDFDGAITAYSQSIRLNPRNASAFLNRGNSWAEKGELDRAVADESEALRLDPRYVFAYDNRAVKWQMKGDYDKAIADASEAIRLAPKAGRPYAVRGYIWRQKGDLDQALQDENRAIALGSDAMFFLVRADTYRYLGEFEKALADYEQSLNRLPNFIAAYAGRGLTYEKMGDLARAREEFEKAINSPSPIRSDNSGSGLETARAHLAALDSGTAPPVIQAAPAKAATATSIPTPQAAIPAAAAPRLKQGRRVALVIGNSGYVNVPALPNPERDAAAMAATLRAIGFDVVTLETNDGREKLINALRNFANEADKADWAMVYYAGHGIEMGGVNYLIPIDARLATDRDVQFEAVPFDQVMAALEGARKLKLVLLDACRDNPFAPQMRRTPAPEDVAAASTAGAPIGTRSIGRGLGEVKVSGATLVVYAAKQGEVALDGDGGNSPFAVAVVQRIATPGVEINKIFRLVRDDVMEATAGRQEPYTYGSLPGSEDFFFVRR